MIITIIPLVIVAPLRIFPPAPPLVRSPYGVVANVIDYDRVVSVFEL